MHLSGRRIGFWTGAVAQIAGLNRSACGGRSSSGSCCPGGPSFPGWRLSPRPCATASPGMPLSSEGVAGAGTPPLRAALASLTV